MSALETTIWYILGYATMPLIFLIGFILTAVVACWLLERLGHGDRAQRASDFVATAAKESE